MSDEILNEDVPSGPLTITEEEMELLVELAAQAAQAAADERQAVLDNIGSTIENKFNYRCGNRKVKESQWLESMRLYLGSLANYNVLTNQYPLGNVNQNAEVSKPEVNIVRNKCETAIAQTMAYQFAAGDKNWNLRIPQNFDIDEEERAELEQLSQQMRMRVEDILAWRMSQMEYEMEAHLENTEYGLGSRKAAWDRVVLGTGVLKGPTNSTRVRKVYKKSMTSDGTPIRMPVMVPEYVPEIYCVNPWYFFPDDTVTDIKDAADTIEVHPLSKMQLREFLNNPAFMADQVELVLKDEKPATYPQSPFADPAYLTQGTNLLKDRYLVMEFHGTLSRSDLTAIGKDIDDDNSADEFFVEVWVVNGKTIRVEFSNLEGCYRCPYAVSQWESDPASMFGFGIPMLVRDQQRVTNETFKMMLDNAGISAGPQVVVDLSLISPVEGGLECTPFKVWAANEYGADVSKAIQFFVPPNQYEGLAALFTLSMGLADSESSIPNFALNSALPTGEANSATGMAIVQQNANSPLFYKSEQWDDQITKPTLTMLFDWEMQFNKRDEIKGTYDIDVRTSTSMLQSGLNQQKLERLRMELAQGSPIGEWVNMDQLAQASLMDMHFPYRTIIKTPEQVARERAEAPPPPPDPNLVKAQAAMEKVQVDKARVQLENKRLEVEANQKHLEARMEYEAQMRTDEIRSQEAQASVLKAQFDFQSQMAALAAKDEENRNKLVADLNIEGMKLQAQKFLKGAEIGVKLKDQELFKEELAIKRKQGSGI